MSNQGKFRLAYSIVTVSLLAACATTPGVSIAPGRASHEVGTAPARVSDSGVMTNPDNRGLYSEYLR